MKNFFRLSALIISASAVWYAASAGTGGCDSSGAACRPSPHDLGHYFAIGGALVDNSAVSDRVESLGYPEIPRHLFTLGFGGLRRYGRYVSGGEIEALAWKPTRSGEFFSSFSSGRLMSRHGISLLPSPNVALFPLFGMGVGMSSLRVKRIETDFDAAIGNPPVERMHSETMTQMTMLLDAGIGFQLSRPAHPGSSTLKTIGLRAGYMFDPLDKGTWRRGDEVLKDGPHSDLSGPYVKLTLGKIRGKSGDGRSCGKGSCGMVSCPRMKDGCMPAGCQHMKDAGMAGCCPHMKDAGKAGCCPHMKDAGKAGCCPHMKDAGKVGGCSQMKEAVKTSGCPMMKEAGTAEPAQPEETSKPPSDTKDGETK